MDEDNVLPEVRNVETINDWFPDVALSCAPPEGLLDIVCSDAMNYAKYDEKNNTNVAEPESIQVFIAPELTTSNQASQPDDSGSTLGISCMLCFCGKQPVAIPMIQCASCRTWVYLSCTGHEINNIPKNFKCIVCPSIPSEIRIRKKHSKKKCLKPCKMCGRRCKKCRQRRK